METITYRQLSSGEPYRDLFEARGWRKPRKKDAYFEYDTGNLTAQLTIQYAQTSHTGGTFGGRPVLNISDLSWSKVGSRIALPLKKGKVASFFSGPDEYYDFFGSDFSAGQAPVRLLLTNGQVNTERLTQVAHTVEGFISNFDQIEYWHLYRHLFLYDQMATVVAGVFGSLQLQGRDNEANSYYNELYEFSRETAGPIPKDQWDLLNLTLVYFSGNPTWSARG